MCALLDKLVMLVELIGVCVCEVGGGGGGGGGGVVSLISRPHTLMRRNSLVNQNFLG